MGGGAPVGERGAAWMDGWMDCQCTTMHAVLCAFGTPNTGSEQERQGRIGDMTINGCERRVLLLLLLLYLFVVGGKEGRKADQAE